MTFSLMTINLIYEAFSDTERVLSRSEGQKLYESLLTLAHAVGFKAVEVSALEVQFLGIETVREILRRNDLRVSSYIHFGQFANPDQEESSKALNEALAAIEVGVSLGTNLLMMVPLPHEGILAMDRGILADQLVKSWLPVVKRAAEKHCTVVVEDTPELSIPLGTATELGYVLDRVPGLRVVYDSGNVLLVNEDPVAYYDAFADRTSHVHLKDMKITNSVQGPSVNKSIDGTMMSGTLHGTGLVDFKTLLSHLRQNRYEGLMTVEYCPTREQSLHNEENLRSALAYLGSLW